MKKTILFSPIGMTDPIRYFRDGAMLNIIRYYSPDIIYLYMSKEICKLHESDNRYVYTIEQLGKLMDREFQIEILQRPELENVQLFDSFLIEFTDILGDIHEKYPDDKIILNVSSGTPAMKSSLQILSLTLDYDILPVQVSTPKKRSNPRIDDEKNATCEELWELNDSNNAEDNRCIVSETGNLLTEFKKQMMIKLINSYDYPAAVELAEDMTIFSDRFMCMLSAASSRLKLKYFKTKTEFKKYEHVIPSSVKKEIEEITEYIMLLKIKLIKEEYADFIRAITPAIVNEFEIYLKEKCGINVDNFVETDSKGVRGWSVVKLSGSDILKCLNELYGKKGGLKNGSPVNSDSLFGLIYKFSGDMEIAKCAEKLRVIEKKIRNKAAHTIVSVTDDDIRKETGFTSDEIFSLLIKMLKYSGVLISEKCLGSYDTMNEYLLSEMNFSED